MATLILFLVIGGIHWVLVYPFLLFLLLPLLSLPDVRISIFEFSPLIFAPMNSNEAHLLKQTRVRQMRRASRRTEQVAIVSPEPLTQVEQCQLSAERMLILLNFLYILWIDPPHL